MSKEDRKKYVAKVTLRFLDGIANKLGTEESLLKTLACFRPVHERSRYPFCAAWVCIPPAPDRCPRHPIQPRQSFATIDRQSWAMGLSVNR